MGKNGHKVRIGKLSEFRPQKANANSHTERGLRMLDDAMSEDGYVAPMTAVADNEVIDGSARLERAFDKFNDEAIILEHDGRRPIVTVRTDIPNAQTKEAKRIAVRANRIPEVDLAWNTDILQTLEPAELAGMFSDKELAALCAILPTGADWMAAFEGESKGPLETVNLTFVLPKTEVETVKSALSRFHTDKNAALVAMSRANV